jgi:hypothetical protein
LSPDLNIGIIWESFQSAGNILSLSDIELINEICMALDNCELICLIFCDVSKAFDRVWLRGLLLKLERYGIKGESFQSAGNILSLSDLLKRRHKGPAISYFTPLSIL